jgi:hypothetical protein
LRGSIQGRVIKYWIEQVNVQAGERVIRSRECGIFAVGVTKLSQKEEDRDEANLGAVAWIDL